MREMPPRSSFILQELVRYGFGIADDERTVGPAQSFELVARDRRPAALLPILVKASA